MRWRELFSVLSIAFVAGACVHLRPVGPPVGGAFDTRVPDDAVRGAIEAGLGASDFTVDESALGTLTARHVESEFEVRVSVRYGSGRYAITYLDSAGLGATLDERGETVLEARYHRLVIDATRAIDDALSRTSAAIAPIAATSGGEHIVPSAPVVFSPAVPAGYAAAPASAPTTVAATPTATAPVAPTPAPEAVTEPTERPRRMLEEEFYPSLTLFVASWVVTWASTIGFTNDGTMIGLSLIPIAGPFAQLSQLEWARYPRWTGWYYPGMGLTQLFSAVGMIVGALVRIPARARAEHAWLVSPMVGSEEVGLVVGGGF